MKILKNVGTIFLMCLFLISCDDSLDAPSGEYVDLGMKISILSSAGNDLLDPENPDHIEWENIKIFHLEGEELVEVYDPMMDAPRGFSVYKVDSNFLINVSGNIAADKIGETVIKWGEEDTDILTYEIVRKNNGGWVSISKVWFNGEEVWNEDNGNDLRHFVIKK